MIYTDVMMDAYRGVVITESLENTSVLDEVRILSTTIEQVSEGTKTPWLKIWTLHDVEIDADKVEVVAQKISHSIDREHAHAWYADFRNSRWHYIIFLDKIFVVDVHDQSQYDEAKQYGLDLGIPESQMPFVALQ